MTSYWLPKVLILCVLVFITRILLRRPKNASRLAMRRLAMLLLIVSACVAVLFPGVLNALASMMGIEKGINLLVYGLVLALFAQMATSYRRDADAEIRLTTLARALALSDVQRRVTPEAAALPLNTPGDTEGADSPTDPHTQATINTDERTNEGHQ